MRGEVLVQSISRSLDILERICQSPEGMGVTQLASALGLAKTTVHRILRALLERGYIYQDPNTGIYAPGTKVLEIAADLRGAMVPQQKVGPLVRELKRNTGEHAYFATIAPDRQCMVVCNEESSSRKDVMVGTAQGKRFPLHTDASRVAYMAKLSDYEREAVLRYLSDQLAREDLAHLKEALTQEARDYYADQDTMGEGVTSIASVVMDHSGYSVGVMGVIVPSYRLTPPVCEQLGRTVRDTALRTSIALGYFPSAAPL